MNIRKFPNKRKKDKCPAQDNSGLNMLSGFSHHILSGGKHDCVLLLGREKERRGELVRERLKAKGIGIGVTVRPRKGQGSFKITSIETVGPSAVSGITALFGKKLKDDGSYAKSPIFLGYPEDFLPV